MRDLRLLIRGKLEVSRDGVVAGSLTNVAPPLFAENEIYIYMEDMLLKRFREIFDCGLKFHCLCYETVPQSRI